MVTPMGVLSLSRRKNIEKTKLSTGLGCFKLSMLHFLEVLYQVFPIEDTRVSVDPISAGPGCLAQKYIEKYLIKSSSLELVVSDAGNLASSIA